MDKDKEAASSETITMGGVELTKIFGKSDLTNTSLIEVEHLLLIAGLTYSNLQKR